MIGIGVPDYTMFLPSCPFPTFKLKTMTIEELRELFSDMLSKGIEPMLCDTEIPRYEASVPCGNPTMCAEDLVGTELLPRQLLSMNPEFMVPVRGDSMKDAGIVAGDMVKVMGDTRISDGDIVLACIDGEYTLKTYFEDDEGQRWLVPQNERYDPILLSQQHNVRLLGTVKEVVKRAPRVASKLCSKAIARWKAAQPVAPVISQLQVSQAIREVAPMVEVARQWYAVYRVLADLNVVREDDFDTFINMVVTEVPQHKNLPTRTEMQRMAVQSFAKPVSLWRADNAPVMGKRYNDYLRIAQRTRELLGC